MHSRKQTAELAALLARRNPKPSAYAVARDTLALCRLATAAQTCAVNLCNVPNYQDTFDRKTESLDEKMGELLKTYSLTATIGGDPRGFVTRLHAWPGSVPVPSNTYAGTEGGFGL